VALPTLSTTLHPPTWYQRRHSTAPPVHRRRMWNGRRCWHRQCHSTHTHFHRSLMYLPCMGGSSHSWPGVFPYAYALLFHLCHITSSLSSSGPPPVSGVSIDGTCHPPPPNLDSQYTSWSHTTHACQAHCFYASSAFVWALLHQSLASVLWAECRGLEGQCTTNIQSFWEGSSLYGHFCIDPWLLSGCRAQGPERAMHY
jgi:hypothetical protein